MGQQPVVAKPVALNVCYSAFVVIDEDVALTGAQEFFVRGKVIAPANYYISGSYFVFAPDNRSLTEKGLFLPHEIVSISDENVPIKVIKSDQQRIILRQGTRMGSLEQLNHPNGYMENLRMFQSTQSDNVSGEQSLKFDFEGVSAENKVKLESLLREYSDIFSKSPMDIGCTTVVAHHIDTGDAAPIAVPPRRVPVALEEKVDKWLKIF